MRKYILISFLIGVIITAFPQSFTIVSPDQNLELQIEVNSKISMSVNYKNKAIIEKAVLGMSFTDGRAYGLNPELKSHTVKNNSGILSPAVPHKDAHIKDEYVQLELRFKGNYQLTFRAYNDGVSYRFSDTQKKNRNLQNEILTLTFPDGTTSLFPQEESMYSHNERLYLDKALTGISSEDFCSLPVVFNTGNAKVLLTETALHNYPGMFIRGNSNKRVTAIFPKYVLKAVDNKEQPDRNQDLVEKADYIAKISGKRVYPWRVFIISDDDRTFIESNLTFQLSKPLAIKNTDWIKPGKVAWDWYNANNIYDVDFKSGLNTKTYKYYIDFAAEHGIEYVILDEGWTKSTTDILHMNPQMDVHELIKYGKEKNVSIILWVLWKPLDANLDKILETYKSWGAKGIKVDFMQRNDQYMVNSYERIAKKCAELELLVDYHGAFKPSGLRRMYPNVINYEGVKGSENNKWSKDITPEHNVTIPFIRMAAGPMDYTPGAMANAHDINYQISFERPMSLGTRAHQVAMYVVYEAPLQMLCDSPSRYYDEKETVDFIVQIPTTWDETIVLHGSIGAYAAIARRKGDTWYIGAMTNTSPRELNMDLSFLDNGTYTAHIFKDGPNADRFAEDYSIRQIEITNRSKITVEMASGGGWTAIITKK